MIKATERYDSISLSTLAGDRCFSVMSRCFRKTLIFAIKRTIFKLSSRDYLLTQPAPSPRTAKIIGKDDSKPTEKPEKKEKKVKEMSESRVKKFQKLFGQQVSADEKLINYFSCALIAEILLQGHLYVSENYFSFYSNVFGYVTKLVIPIGTVKSLSKEKTAKFFPNAIALQLSEGKHVFGSFLSRETAYQLMISIHRRNELSIEPAEGVEEELEADEVDGAQGQDVEVSSLEDSSSISGSESQIQFQTPLPILNLGEAVEEESPAAARNMTQDVPNTPTAKVGSYKVKLISEFNLLFIGICLTILLAFFSGLLLLKINAIEKHSQPISHDLDSSKFTIEDAESILNKNVMVVRNVRKQLEALHEMLQNSFDNVPTLGDKQEF